MSFDPSEVGLKGKLFGFPYNEEQSDMILIPVPWDVTTSYQDGTRQAPEIIRVESSQLDFSLPQLKDGHSYPVCMIEQNDNWAEESKRNRKLAVELINKLEGDTEFDNQDLIKLTDVNRASHKFHQEVKEVALKFLRQEKIVGTIGGDHSTPLGLIQALGENYSDFGILQIDAHMDLRDAYEGFEYSHASIMTNALKVESVSKLVQVGIRDYCKEEEDASCRLRDKVFTYFDEELIARKWNGEKWSEIVKEIVSKLPNQVYISFDIDGLDPSLCPHTGTPVPGGLQFYEAVWLIEEVVKSGRKIIGFDLSETGSGLWDANVASRILYRLVTATGVSRGHLTFG